MPVVLASEKKPLLGLEPLMLGYQQADQEAARTLIEKVSPLLLRFFWRTDRNRRFAEDLVQETWIRVHRARPTYRPGEPVLPWIFAIARHTGLDYYRKTRRVDARETQVEVMPETAAPVAEEDQGNVEMEAMLAELPASQREVLILLKISGMSIEEVARVTSSSAGSVKQKAHRAYEKLREVFGRRERSK